MIISIFYQQNLLTLISGYWLSLNNRQADVRLTNIIKTAQTDKHTNNGMRNKPASVSNFDPDQKDQGVDLAGFTGQPNETFCS